MKHLIRLLLGVIFVTVVIPASAQTTRSLFAGGLTVGTSYSPSFTFYDSSCRQVTYHGSYPPATLNWFQTDVYCNGFSAPIATFVYSRYDYPSPSPIISCSSSHSNDPNLVFYSFTGCSAYVGAIVPPAPQTKDLVFWDIGSYLSEPYVSLKDPNCSTTKTWINGDYATSRYRISVYCPQVSGPVIYIDYHFGGGSRTVTKNISPSVITNTSVTADYVKLVL
jgi:hypothetical protein